MAGDVLHDRKGDGDMKQSVVALILLTSAATAYAECAWMLWMNDAGERTPNTAPVDTFATKEECEARRFRLIGLHRDTRPLMHHLCLPDTVAPRGPKGK